VALVTQWLSEEMPLSSRPMLLGTVEAMKTVVSLARFGDVHRAGRRGCRPDPKHHRPTAATRDSLCARAYGRINKQNNPALDVVQEADVERLPGFFRDGDTLVNTRHITTAEQVDEKFKLRGTAGVLAEVDAAPFPVLYGIRSIGH
jgi:hypothetical protein